MQWLALDFKTFLTKTCLGTLTLIPQNLEKGSNFRFHLKNLKGPSILQNHHHSFQIVLYIRAFQSIEQRSVVDGVTGEQSAGIRLP